jgi:dTDP-4-dehydrorhamnose reductase
MSRVAVTGSGGQLGRQLVDAFERAGHQVIGLDRAMLDIADPAAASALTASGPEVVVNAAAWTDVDGCARDPDRAMELNGAAPGRLARAAAEIGAVFVQVSTNEVFDGQAMEPYPEDAPTGPINPYAASKLAGERAVVKAGGEHLIVRTAWVFGPGGTNFPSRIVRAALGARERHEPLRVVVDELGNPTWAPDLAQRIVAAVAAQLRGVLHLAGEPAASRFDWAQVILRDLAGVELQPIPQSEYPRASAVPPRAVLDMSRAYAAGLEPMDWRPPTATYAAELLQAAEAGAGAA